MLLDVTPRHAQDSCSGHSDLLGDIQAHQPVQNHRSNNAESLAVWRQGLSGDALDSVW